MPEPATVWTLDDWRAELIRRFGPSPRKYRFVCPKCGDEATGQDFLDAYAGDVQAATDHLGRECIGRALGALAASTQDAWRERGGRGCDWAAYGLFQGPEFVLTETGERAGVFRMAEVAA